MHKPIQGRRNIIGKLGLISFRILIDLKKIVL